MLIQSLWTMEAAIASSDGRFARVRAGFPRLRAADPLPDGAIWWEADSANVPALSAMVDAPLHVIGHSLGGAASICAARSRPDCIARLIVIEPVLLALLGECGLPVYVEAQDISDRVRAILRDGNREAAAMALPTSGRVRVRSGALPRISGRISSRRSPASRAIGTGCAETLSGN